MLIKCLEKGFCEDNFLNLEFEKRNFVLKSAYSVQKGFKIRIQRFLQSIFEGVPQTRFK